MGDGLPETEFRAAEFIENFLNFREQLFAIFFKSGFENHLRLTAVRAAFVRVDPRSSRDMTDATDALD